MKSQNQKDVQEQALRKRITERRLATNESLCTRKLSLAEIKSMPSLVYEWHQFNNHENLDRTINAPAQIKEYRRNAHQAKAQKLWSKGTIEDAKKIAAIGEAWVKNFPQLDNTEENVTILVTYLKQRNELVNPETLTSAYEHCCAMGLLWVTPENIGLEGSESIRGLTLTERRDFHLFLKSYIPRTDKQREAVRIANLSADQYRAEFLPSHDVPPMVLANIKRHVQTFKETLQPSYVESEENRTALLAWIERNNMPITAQALNAAFLDLKAKGELADIDDTGIVVHAGVSTLTSYPSRNEPLEHRPVVICELETPKRVSMREILSWSSDRLKAELQANPELQRQLDFM